MIRELRCYLLVCDGCGTTFEDDGREFVPHYDHPEQARENSADCDWTREENLDRCPPCTCKSRGHQWVGPFSRHDPPCVSPYRVCQRCSRIQAAPADATIEAQGEGR
jgi:hypothetical protein